MREWEKPLLPAGAQQRKKMLLAEEVEQIRIAPDGVHVEFFDGIVRTYRAKDLKFELPEGHVVDLDTLLKQHSIEGYVFA